MKKIKTVILIILCLQLLFSCSHNTDIKFNRERWLNDDPAYYFSRRYMVTKIIDDSLLIGKTSFEVDSILGQANSTNTTLKGKPSVFYYSVQISYGSDIDPKYFKTLLVTIDTLLDRACKVELYESPDKRSFWERQMTN